MNLSWQASGCYAIPESMAAFTSNRLKAAIYIHYGFRGVAIWLPYGFAMVAIRYLDLACLGKGLAGNVTQG